MIDDMYIGLGFILFYMSGMIVGISISTNKFQNWFTKERK